jgi:hypothetical protein
VIFWTLQNWHLSFGWMNILSPLQVEHMISCWVMINLVWNFCFFLPLPL